MVARLIVRADRLQQSSGEQARELCAQAAALLEQVLQEEPGHMHAQYNLGYCYEKLGEFGKAVKWIRKVAEQGLAGAQCNLGASYANGEGVRKDAVKAVKWYRKAAEQGDAEAQCNLGSCYVIGEGVRKDAGKAVEWWPKAAELGCGLAVQARSVQRERERRAQGPAGSCCGTGTSIRMRSGHAGQ